MPDKRQPTCPHPLPGSLAIRAATSYFVVKRNRKKLDQTEIVAKKQRLAEKPA